ncbi:MAG: hypothetical protein JWN48_1252 [Myxococcaceae bacterium]|nr:hypothetical protein [Myxococcaceae bacterium]
MNTTRCWQELARCIACTAWLCACADPQAGLDDDFASAHGDARRLDGGFVRIAPPPADAEHDGAPPASDAAPSTDAGTSAVPPSSTPTAMGKAECGVEGRYALDVEADVHWSGSALLDVVPVIVPGSGTITIRAFFDVRAQGPAYTSEVRACAATVPSFAASTGEQYGIDFPPALFEKLSRQWSTATRLACLEPGCAVETDYLAVQLGTVLPSYEDWPSPRDPLDSSLVSDDDHDGRPGISVSVRGPDGDPPHQYPPASYLLDERIGELMLALRVGAALDGVRASCDQLSGSASTLNLDIRAVGCRLTTGVPCTLEQLSFVNTNLPTWKVDRGRWKATRLAADAGCEQALTAPL